tara:strand:- start:68 stop:298 length:231 start_codon:yes stop_codon:yes gene_type:complete
MYNTLRQYIRALLENLLVEPDSNDKDSQDENTLAGAGIRGVTGPIGSSPKKSSKKNKSDTTSRAFGGGRYKDDHEA